MLLVCFGTTPSGIQGLLLALNSGFTPVRLREPYGVSRMEFRLAMYKAITLVAVLSLVSGMHF